MQSVKKFIEDENGMPVPYVDNGNGVLVPALWAPYPGSQEIFLALPCIGSDAITEACAGGGKGSGKTNALLMDFAQHCLQRYDAAWKGLIVRRHLKQLEELIHISHQLFPRAFPGQVEFNWVSRTWKWTTGETLRMAHFYDEAQYQDFHGLAYPAIYIDEATMYPNDGVLRYLLTILRSTAANMPRKLRMSTNPSGPGHNWVYMRYRLPLPGFPHQLVGPLIDDAKDERGNLEPKRRYIHFPVEQNLLLMHNDPDYITRVCAGATSEAQYRAYRYGDWSIVAGGMFDDIWSKCREHCVVPRFQNDRVPEGWKIHRAHDPGSAKPASFGWYAESDGTPVAFADGRMMNTLRGDIFRWKEWYVWTGKPNEGVKHLSIRDLAEGVREREERWGVLKRVKRGPSDISIFDDNYGFCAADVYDTHGVGFEKAAKGPNSRKEGWQQLRMYLQSTIPPEEGKPREHPGLFIVGDDNPQWLRTVPTLPRQEGDEDDIDTSAEDHIADETRYRLRFSTKPAFSTRRHRLF